MAETDWHGRITGGFWEAVKTAEKALAQHRHSGGGGG